MTVRIGFIGAGFITTIHRFFLSGATIDHVISAVHDIDPERAAAFAEATGAEVLGEDELLAAVDAVFITTWTSEHPRLVAKAAAAGLAIFCEKPLGVDAATVDEMVASVEAVGVVNQVGLVLRFLAPFRIVKHLLADERAGAPLAVAFRDDQYIPIQGQYGSTWRADPALCGRGALLEHSIHDVDVLRWWFGPVASVSATAREYHGLDKIDDVVAARFDFENGGVATLISVWHDILERPSNRHIEIFCARLHITIEGDLRGPVRWRFTGEDEQVLEGGALEKALAAFGDTDSNPAEVFLRSVVAGEGFGPAFAAAVPAHRIVDALYRSAADDGASVRDPER